MMFCYDETLKYDQTEILLFLPLFLNFYKCRFTLAYITRLSVEIIPQLTK